MSQVTLIKGEGRYPAPEIRRIHPSKRLLWKYFTILILLWLILVIIVISIPIIIFTNLNIEQERVSEILEIFIIICLGLSSIFFLPIIAILPFYIRSMEFIVHGDEIMVRKGVFNKTVKHCPYKNIVNISTTAGPLDRLFRIGNVNIETAGSSGLSTEPEEKLEGLILYQEIRDYVLRQIRTYQSTQKDEFSSIAAPSDSYTLKREIIQRLEEIRDLLKKRLG